jgi:hypothetical protein
MERRAVKAFVRAENLFWFRSEPNDCVPRSLALFRFLRSIGLPATHFIGVMRFPGFLMHAWVTGNEEPLLERADDIERFTIISRLR